jgi:hypothetical protein
MASSVGLREENSLAGYLRLKFSTMNNIGLPSIWLAKSVRMLNCHKVKKVKISF